MSKAEEHLRRLEAAELVRLGRSGPELEYWFKHSLIQEMVYSSLLRSSRTELHRRVAEVIEATVPADVPERAALLAMHFDRAGLPRQTLKYAVQAGDSALRAYALHEALRFYDQALAIDAQLADPALSGTIHLAYAGRGQTLQAFGENFAALANYQEMLTKADNGGNPAQQADALNRLAPVYSMLNGFTPELVGYLNRALDLAKQTNDQLLTARALWNMGLAHRFHDPPHALSFLEQALVLAEAAPAADEPMRVLLGHVLNDLTITAWVGGHLRQAEAYGERAMAIFRELDLRPMMADTLGGQGMMYWLMGKHERSQQVTEEGLRLSQAIENVWAVIYTTSSLISLDLDAGRFEQGLEKANRVAAAARVAGFPAFHGMIQWQLGLLHFAVGNRELGLEAVAEGAEALESMHAPIWSAMARGAQALAALERNEPQQAWMLAAPLSEESAERQKDLEGVVFVADVIIRAALEAGELSHATRFCSWFVAWTESEGIARMEGEARYWCGLVHASAGESGAAEGNLLRARELLTAAKVLPSIWRVDLALARLNMGQGKTAAAEKHEALAREALAALAAGIVDPDLRQQFLARARELEGLEL